jgi:hypothetical protein
MSAHYKIPGVSGEKINILVGDSIGHREKKKFLTNICPILSDYRDTAV